MFSLLFSSLLFSSLLFIIFTPPLLSSVINIHDRPNGVIVEAENKAKQNKNVKPGDVVTFSYVRGDSSAKPKVLRIRFDLSWSEVLRGFGVDPALFKGMNKRKEGGKR